MLYTNTSIDTQSLTENTGLDSFMDLAVLVLRGSLVAFTYRQAAQTVKVKLAKQFGGTPLVVIA